MRSSVRKRVFNDKRKGNLKSSLKAIRLLISEKKIKEAQGMLPKVFQAIDKAAKRGVIKKKNASRKKSRLARSLVTK